MLAATLSRFSRLLHDLREAAVSLPADQFQPWALDRLSELLPIDAGIWSGRRWQRDNPVTHHVYVHRMSFDMVTDYERGKHHGSAIMSYLAEGIGQARIVPPELLHDGVVGDFMRRWKIAQILSMYLPDPALGLIYALSLYRSKAEPAYTETERVLLEAAMPHLVAAHRDNRLRWLDQSVPGQQQCYTAAADAQATLHLAQPGFLRLIADEWPDWRGPDLPMPLAGWWRGNSSDQRWIGRQSVLWAGRAHDLRCLYARPAGPVDRLTAREREVAGLFAGGRSHKEIARLLANSPATVRNQIAAVYQKLEVSDKGSLARVLGPDGFEDERRPPEFGSRPAAGA